MRKENLEKLLDSIYELEGLVHLAINRDDEPAMLPELIRRKSRELLDHAREATEAATVIDKEEAESTVNAVAGSSVKEMGVSAANIEEEEVEISETVIPQYPEEIENEYPQATQSAFAEDTAPEAVAVSETVFVKHPEPESTESTAPEQPEAIEPEQAAAQQLEQPVIKDEEKPAQRVEKETYKFDEYSEPRGRLVFSINDRYRFRRELFNGSDVDFNTTLSLVASMDDYEEAADYFLDELQWDEKSPDVVDFLEILKNYFK